MSIIETSVCSTDLMQANLVKQSSFQALSIDILSHEPPFKVTISYLLYSRSDSPF